MLTLRHTELDLLQRCPLQYEFFKTVGPMPPSAALHLGSSYHEGQRAGFKGKLETGDYNLVQVCDAYSDYFDKYHDLSVVFADEEKPGDLKDVGIKLLSAYALTQADLVQPVEVEKSISRESVNLPGVILTGKIDLITADAIIDHKTTSRLPSETDLANDIQANTYLLLHPVESGEFRFHYAHKTKLAIFEKITHRTPKEQTWFQEILLARYVRMIIAGIFPPSTEGYWCSESYCGWYLLCKGKG